MKTPIYDFLTSYADGDAVRMHMPGHKGCGNNASLDLTEISGADSLYEADGIIRESEENAGRLFGADTFYSAEGSSLSIRAMTLLISNYARKKGKRPLILAARNVHKAFISAAALVDFGIEWIIGDRGSYLSSRITAEALDKRLSAMKELPVAVYVTSPDYLGFCLDIGAISAVCKRHKVILAVDNAHGAYLKFLDKSRHPIDLGADIVCDSAHKTLPTLTGGAYLHLSKGLDPYFKENAKGALSLFGSTSPSYLILSSLDKTNEILAYGYRDKLRETLKKIREIKNSLTEKSYVLFENEPMKITVSAKAYGYTGYEIQEYLENEGIYPEFADPDYLVLMPSASSTDKELSLVEKTLLTLPRRREIRKEPPSLGEIYSVCSPREAILSLGEKIPTCESSGRVLRSVTVGCPPAVPIVASGEVITKEAVRAFEYYGIKSVEVIKK